MESPKFIGKVKLTNQGQITLPIEARSDLGIKPGDDLYWYELSCGLIIVKDLVNQNDLLDTIVKAKKTK